MSWSGLTSAPARQEREGPWNWREEGVQENNSFCGHPHSTFISWAAWDVCRRLLPARDHALVSPCVRIPTTGSLTSQGRVPPLCCPHLGTLMFH